MAKIALAVAEVAATLIAGYFGGPGAAAVVAGISTAINTGVAILTQPKGKLQIPLQDLQVSSSADGSPIPFFYANNRFAGQVIWSPKITFIRENETSGGGSGGGGGSSVYIYYASFAAAFGEGPAYIKRIWFDAKIVYKAPTGTAGNFGIGDIPVWDPTVAYNVDDIVTFTAVGDGGDPTGAGPFVFQCIFPNTGISPQGNSLYWEQSSDYPPWQSGIVYQPGALVDFWGQIYAANHVNPGGSPAGNTNWTPLAQYYVPPTIYPGDENQLPDPTIQANEGVANTPAYRGLLYAKWENFPLANFGNRIPNIRAETSTVPFSSGVSAVVGGKTHVGEFGYGITENFSFAGFEPIGVVDPAETAEGSSSGPDVEFAINLIDVQPVPGPPGSLVFIMGQCRTSWCFGILTKPGTIQSPSINTANSDAMADYAVPTGNHRWTGNFAGPGAQPSGGFASLIQDSNVPSGAYDLVLPDNQYEMEIGSVTVANASTYEYQRFYISSADVPINITFHGATFQSPNVYGGIGAPSNIVMLYVGGIVLAFVQTDGAYVFPWFVPTGWAIVNDPYTLPYSNGWISIFKQAVAPTIAATPCVPVGDIVLDVCKRAGIANDLVDVSLLTSGNLQPTNLCCGYTITRPTAAASILQVLLQAFFFDICESDGKLKCVPRGFAPVETIPESDLGLEKDKAKLVETIGQEQDLPRDVTVLYIDEDLDYQQGKQIKARNARIVSTKNQEIITLPLTMDADFARQVAEKALYLRWLERNAYATNLWQAKYMLLDPTDVLQFIYEGMTFQIRVVDTSIGQGFVVAINGVGDNARNYLSSAQGGKATTGGNTIIPPADIAAPTLLFLFDIPLLRDQDANLVGTGFYYAMSSGAKNWTSGVLYQSADNATFAQEDTDNQEVSFGYATNVLPAPQSPWTWDYVNTLNVKMIQGTLQSDTELNVLNDSNAIISGGEVIQFQNARLETDGSYTLSKLLRARRGTDPQIGNHATGELVVDLHSGMKRVADPLSILNALRYYRGVTNGGDPSLVASQDFTITGNDLKPYAPVHIVGLRDGSGNLTINWIRRTRIGGAWLNFVGTVPLSETSELYDVDILQGATVVRTLADLPSPTVAYSAAQQAADLGAAEAAISVNVYQKSGVVGRGFAGSATV
jgi:Putative phage tail protein